MSLFTIAAHTFSNPRPSVAMFGAAVLLTVTAGSARADLKVVSQTTAGERKVTTTTYYKGKKARVETGDRITIIDGTGKTYIVNTQNKTYSVMKANDTSMQQVAGAMDMFDITADVKPGGKTKTILGKSVKNYRFTIRLKPNATFQARMKEMTKNNPNAAVPSMANFLITVNGEEWVTEAFNVGMGGNPGMAQSMTMIPNFRKIASKFSVIKGVSLESSTTTTMGNANAGGRNQVTKTVASSLSQNPLPDSLFEVPLGYKLQPMTNNIRPGGPPR